MKNIDGGLDELTEKFYKMFSSSKEKINTNLLAKIRNKIGQLAG
jgi:hypothetical protein